MFKRDKKPTFYNRFFNILWPSIGWKRSILYMILRLVRLPGSSHSIACGFACGAAVSFSPFVGLHFILGGLMAWIMRGNVIASLFGTVVGNPWTFPFIWLWIYEVGCWLNFDQNKKDIRSIQFSDFFRNLFESIGEGNFLSISELSTLIFITMLLGSIPTMIIIWIIFYFFLSSIMNKYQK